MRKNEEEQSAKVVRYMSSVLFGGVTALVLCLVFLLLCSLGISSGWINTRYMVQCTLAGCTIGSFIGGMLAVVRCRAKTLLVGLGTGAVMFLLLLTIGLVFYPDMSAENRGVGLLCAALLGGAIAGLLGGKPKKKRRK